MSNKKRERLILAGALAGCFLLFGWRQFYGFNKNDEIFYISTVYRFFQGDALLVDEWNSSQLFSMAVYPLFGLFRLLHRSNEGIVLASRFAYLFFQAAVSIYCYVRLKRFGWGRVLPALFYFVTTPYNINALSYNTLAFGFALLTLTTVASAERINAGTGFLCGLFAAGAVLSNPYMMILFIFYGCVCVVCSVYCWRKGRVLTSFLSLRAYLWMCGGAFLAFLVFLVFVFSRGSLAEVWENLPYFLMYTEGQLPFPEKFAKYFIRIHRYYRWLVYLTGAALAAWAFDRGRRIPAWAYLLTVCLTAIPYIIYYGFFWEMVGINYMLIPLSFPGLIAYVVAEHKDRRLFYGWYLPGLFFTLVAHFATNTGILTVSASYMVPSAASLLLILQAAQGLVSGTAAPRRTMVLTALRAAVAALFAVQLLACVWQRVTFVWGDARLDELTCRIEEGPLKGIRTTEENLSLYEDAMRDMEDLELTGDDRFFVVGIAPWMYLNTEAGCGAYSTWEILDSDSLAPAYYELHPQKIPDVVYFYEYGEEALDTELAALFLDMGYETREMRRGIVLETPERR